ncbi:hypothetical protein VISI1226_22747, partial [Vibrio sinaloensis DSM 21326]
SHAGTTLKLNAVHTELDPNPKCQAWGITLKLFVRHAKFFCLEFAYIRISYDSELLNTYEIN